MSDKNIYKNDPQKYLIRISFKYSPKVSSKNIPKILYPIKTSYKRNSQKYNKYILYKYHFNVYNISNVFIFEFIISFLFIIYIYK